MSGIDLHGPILFLPPVLALVAGSLAVWRVRCSQRVEEAAQRSWLLSLRIKDLVPVLTTATGEELLVRARQARADRGTGCRGND